MAKIQSMVTGWMDGVMNDEVHGAWAKQAIIRKWVGHKINICEIFECSKKTKVRRSMGQLTVV